MTYTVELPKADYYQKKKSFRASENYQTFHAQISALVLTFFLFFSNLFKLCSSAIFRAS